MKYLYNYAWEKNEEHLCLMEKRAFFGPEADSGYGPVVSSVKIDPSRSPFIRERISVLCKGESLEDLIVRLKELPEIKTSFKVVFIQEPDSLINEKTGFKERRKIERKVGLELKGEADLINPQLVFGVMEDKEGWIFGEYVKNEAVWLQHQWKPHSYSTALGTRVARSVVNIAVPDPAGKKVIDPCCGIGTVLIEALSMGIDISGSDINHLVIPGVKENMEYFGLQGEVERRDIRDVDGQYDAAIIDLPYNLCSVITVEDQLEMFQSARRFTKRLVVVTIENVDEVLAQAGFKIADRCVVTKGNFQREVLLCV
ncbi:RsmD family RNA methyltransferase [Bacillus sp. P14.5]|uniref:TRM11 family SAM-dependent methyltransferase n=1 Tax=Bacillus sp. P14.5 TaxID=1983400 RepID=UPI000DE9E34F|nr:RsmD family RNA methyltransferase [Bacillus sp. P14.5]